MIYKIVDNWWKRFICGVGVTYVIAFGYPLVWEFLKQ